MDYKKGEGEHWHGTHQEVRFEIRQWSLIPPGMEGKEPFNMPFMAKVLSNCWAYYLYINLDQIEPKSLSDSFWLEPIEYAFGTTHDYGGHPIINDIDLHGDCTFYEKVSGQDGGQKIIKIGCDYQHYNDEEYRPCLEQVLADVENSINKFRKHVLHYEHVNQEIKELTEGNL